MPQTAQHKPGTPPLGDDHLGLLERDFSGVDSLVFTGPSGSGKSTQIRLVCEHHPQFSGLRMLRVDPRISAERRQARSILAGGGIQLLVIDEMLSLRDWWHSRPLLAGPHKSLVATHLPAWFAARGQRTRHIDTGNGVRKLARYLDQRGVAYRPDDLELYVVRYGPVYTELQVILETSPRASLGEAMQQFHRFHKIHRTRCR